MDIIHEREVPPIVIEGEGTARGVHQGSVIVATGAHRLLAGTIQGSVTVKAKGIADIRGSIQGSLLLNGNVGATIYGDQFDSVTVDHHAVLTVTSRGKLGGCLNVYGKVINQGSRVDQ
ncbi:hypothetical protein HQO12_13415 [Rhodococcus fascians]|uniref:hypothetical protein n=1 Tax=Rhodococcoides fascians TaxID=1828 RepID=UPI00195A2879|nr:hypothetical protein [Rhodococcus fascians]MBY3809901.1 hypothetical protein [Rhodococcus fascians]MBY3841404.1 hypothetical protein [Rhodococcus fascians]MBY3844927.1 hypothetical protein [Rhodococcus fascians]MBY3850610.1 hypothetical protein [Rhodococcus fascians]MBY3855132.1 hypothetical protein [Rhodococcus fascians]